MLAPNLRFDNKRHSAFSIDASIAAREHPRVRREPDSTVHRAPSPLLHAPRPLAVTLHSGSASLQSLGVRLLDRPQNRDGGKAAVLALTHVAAVTPLR